MKWLVTLLVLSQSFWVYALDTVYVVKEQRPLYDRDVYLFELLEKALQAAKYNAPLEYVKVHPHQQRTLMMLAQGKVDVLWSMTSPERETLGIAVKVPLFRGYIGKRAILVNQNQLDRFANITTLDALRPLVAVQGHDWPDTKILAHNDLTVRPQAKYEAMFSMLNSHQVDYFPRAFIEVSSELASFQRFPLAIVPNVYLHYPAAFYFFVNKDKPALAKAIENGLAIMEKNGEFKSLFDRYFAANIAALKLDNATVIELENPYFEVGATGG
ncbi:substrate-binding periplasmic protein [Pseudoalteromonas xiamenensis]